MKSNETMCADKTKEIPTISNNEPTKSPEKISLWISKRFLVTFLILLGLVNINFMKGNISIAMVEMTSSKLIFKENRTIIQPAEFKWETTTKGLILNSWGYGGLFSFLLSSLPSRLGGSVTFGTTMMAMSIFTIIVPFVIAHLDFRFFLALRFISGFLENIAFASISVIFRHWIPQSERSRLMSLSYNGTYIGAALLHSICGFVAYQWGWTMVFYTTGLGTLIWALVWLFLVPNDPSKDRWISQKELSYILANIENSTSSGAKTSTPYSSIFSSVPFWALAFCRIFFICLPLFVKDATGKTIDLVGLISSIPSMVCAVLIPLLGITMDYWKNTSSITATKMHKMILGANFFVGGCLLVGSNFISKFVVSIVFITIVRTLISWNVLVSFMVIIHIAPNHSGAVTALTMFWYSLGFILAQFVIGVITVHHSIEDWNNVFYLTAAVMILSSISFTVFGSSEPQSWSKELTEKDPERCVKNLEDSNK